MLHLQSKLLGDGFDDSVVCTFVVSLLSHKRAFADLMQPAWPGEALSLPAEKARMLYKGGLLFNHIGRLSLVVLWL